MKLIDFQGLNCYQNSLVTVAAFMGVDYKRAFANLWPETDFEYDRDHKVYTTKRMLQNLEALGIKPEAFSFASEMEARGALSVIGCAEPFIIEMDTFRIPWSPGFETVHAAHCFAARKESGGRLSCFDPTYNTQYIISGDISAFLFKICRINRVAEKALFSEACGTEITRCHPQMKSRLLGELGKCVNERRKNALFLAKYVDALINNRYLYKYYLDNTPLAPQKHLQFFGSNFFSRWGAVKHGLYKALVVKRNEKIINEVSELFVSLADDEIFIASDV